MGVGEREVNMRGRRGEGGSESLKYSHVTWLAFCQTWGRPARRQRGTATARPVQSYTLQALSNQALLVRDDYSIRQTDQYPLGYSVLRIFFVGTTRAVTTVPVRDSPLVPAR